MRVVTSPTTVIVGGAVVVSGAVTPAGAGSSVALQSESRGHWTTLTTQKSGAAGTFAFHLKAPKHATTWSLRVSRPAAKGVKAVVSATQHLHVVKSAFAVTATASLGTAPGTVVVAGTVSPSAKGTVSVQRLLNGAWIPVATGTLKGSAYSLTVAFGQGASYTLRVGQDVHPDDRDRDQQVGPRDDSAARRRSSRRPPCPRR